MNVRFADEALEDLRTIGDLIAENDEAAALSFERAVVRAAELLGHFPRLGRIVHRTTGVRSIPLPRWGYLLLYLDRSPDEVFVLTVRSGKRTPLFPAETNEE